MPLIIIYNQSPFMGEVFTTTALINNSKIMQGMVNFRVHS